jgi:hypothetical protein
LFASISKDELESLFDGDALKKSFCLTVFKKIYFNPESIAGLMAKNSLPKCWYAIIDNDHLLKRKG